MVKRKLSKQIIEKEPYQIWNSFIDILAMESEDNLSDVQKVAQRSFWYDSEIQNGGHLQYFENTELQDYSSIIDSLKTIGANDFAALLYYGISPDMNHYLKNYLKVHQDDFIEIE